MEPALQEIVTQGQRYSALDYLTATATRMAMGATMGAFHERYDLLLTPTVPITPFVAGEEVPIGWHSQRWTSWTPFTYPFNMTQQPAATVPCGWTSAGMPIGLQVVGPRHADDRVLAACAAYEQVEPWIQVTSLQHAIVTEAQVKVAANLQYQIENTGLKAFRVFVPTNAEGVQFRGTNTRNAFKIGRAHV